MVGLYPGIYNNYAHFSTFFIICIVLLLLRLIGPGKAWLEQE